MELQVLQGFYRASSPSRPLQVPRYYIGFSDVR